MKFQLILLLLIALAHVNCISQYSASLISQNSSSLELKLTYTGHDEYYVKSTSPIIKQLYFQIHCQTFQDFYFKITDLNKTRFQIPQGGKFPQDPLKRFSFPLNLAAFKLEYSLNPFNMIITRKINNEVLFSTYQSQLIFSQYYIQIGSYLGSAHIYGLGQRFNNHFRVGKGKWTMFARDQGNFVDKGQGGLNGYGFYPTYLQREKLDFFHINYIRNSNAMDVLIQQKMNASQITFKMIGGIIDFRFFLGNQNPEQTIQKLHIYLGRSAIPPFWSLGFHQSRYGYKNSKALLEVLDQYQKNQLPLDTIWTDIDYLQNYQDFTVDQQKFPSADMKNITDRVHFVPIIQAAILINNSTYYKQGKQKNVYVKDANGDEYLGQMRGGPSTFVDFLHPNSSLYWSDMLKILNAKLNFSGLWLDMNEYTNYCDGPCQTPKGQSKFDYSKDLPYTPGVDNIETDTLSLNATHFGNLRQAEVHNYAGMLETQATYAYLRNRNQTVKQMPFILTRSATIGANRYGFHWTGDNNSTFEFLKASIADNFINQIWGFQMIGADICGFEQNTTSQLCARWFQLGSLYPFARNHNDKRAIDQQPYALGQDVLEAARNNLNLRYSLLKHYYHLFVIKKGLGSIFKPLFFEFPLQSILYEDQIADTQFLIGNSLMVTPILEQGKTQRNVYFPLEWINFYNGDPYKAGNSIIKNGLRDKVPLFIRSGTGVFTQNTSQVQKSSDLGSQFHLVASFVFEKSKSNETQKYYRSFASMLSIQNYGDNSKIEKCLAKQCLYQFDLQLYDTGNVRTLTFKVKYLGDQSLMQKIIVSGVTVFYKDLYIVQEFVNQLQFTGPTQIVVPINEPASAQKGKNLTQRSIMDG